MAQVAFERVSKIYPDGTRAVNDVNLEIRDGEFMVLVGPSGCGKTTALRMVAGLEEISEGALKIGDRIVNHVPSRDRDIAMAQTPPTPNASSVPPRSQSHPTRTAPRGASPFHA